MTTGHCQEAPAPGASEAQNTAHELFQIAALMLGNEEQAVSLVEETLAGIEADPCADAGTAQDQARPRLIAGALRRMTALDPGTSSTGGEDAPCIDTDDLSAAGLTEEQLGTLLENSGQRPSRMREWLEQLTPALRAIFVLRAIVGQDAVQAAESLRRSGADGALGWKAEQVRTAYRQALCLLATSLVTSNSAAAPA